jgi:D-hydroxyproline dehydrogenase subunit beta
MPHVVIVGAGIMGATLALGLVARGARVTVIDGGQPASGASGASFGWLNASYYASSAHHTLRAAALQAHHRLADAVGPVPTRWPGCLWFEDTGADLDRMADDLRALGYPLRILDRARVARAEPCLANPPDRALLFPSEGATDLAALTRIVLAAAQAGGARAWTGCPVTAIDAGDGRVRGVVTGAGRLAADHVVLAAGTGAPALLAPLGVALPMLRRPGLILTTRAAPPLISHIIAAPGQELRQDAQGHVIAPTTAGHQGDTAEALSDTPHALADRALPRLRALVPGIPDWQAVAVGYRPVPADGLPVIGTAPGVAGLWLSVMHSGATLAPLVAEVLADMVTGQGDGGQGDGGLAPEFRPARFAVP